MFIRESDLGGRGLGTLCDAVGEISILLRTPPGGEVQVGRSHEQERLIQVVEQDRCVRRIQRGMVRR
jgi:hypothetical protein